MLHPMHTAVGEVLQNGRSPMLSSNDMIDLEGERRESIGQMGVLAESFGLITDLLLDGARDPHDDSRSGLLERQSSLGTQQVE